ncbi:MAG TPA: glycosyltransferase, partial [Nitrososphaera sp.]|nr:glycosyltransferase [Nitrososphaera sp.]
LPREQAHALLVVLLLERIVWRFNQGTDISDTMANACLNAVGRIKQLVGDQSCKTSGHRLRVLISAYACEPGKGSEPGVGWNWVRQIVRFHEVWVVTRENNREDIERRLEKEPMPNVHWIYFDLPRWASFWKRGQRGVHLYYYLWQIGVYIVSRRLQKKVQFDLAHHITFGIYWMPSFLAFLPVPFIWGPVGGGESTPKELLSTFEFRGKVYEHIRHLARWLCEKDPFVRLTIRGANAALAKAHETAVRLKALGCREVQVYPESGISNDELPSLKTAPVRNSNSFRLLSIGRQIYWKGFHLGIIAFAKMQREFPESEYWLIGNGPQQRNLKRLAEKLGVTKKVRFLGHLPRQNVLENLVECNVLVHPSLHDSGGWVCLEAMAAGRPVICLDLGGPALQVTDKVGIKVPAKSPEQTVDDLAAAMTWLARNPELRIQMGEAAHQRVAEDFNWNKKGEWVNMIYQQTLFKHEK